MKRFGVHQSSQAHHQTCRAPRVSHAHRSVRAPPSLLLQQHNLISHQQQQQPGVAAHTAGAGQPDRSGAVPCVPDLQSGQQAVQAYAELQRQQQRAEQQDDSSLQRLVTQAGKLPNQADQLWGDPSDRESREVALVEPATRSYADLDYLSVSV